MTIITISRDSYSQGSELAEKVADKLGYQCIARKVLLEASEEYNIPEIKLIRALHDSPSVFERFSSGKERYISYIRYALLNSVKEDNIVYHGLAGQFFLEGVSHVLKVRLISNMEDRVREEVKRENIKENVARQILVKDDKERRKWSTYLFGIDTHDPKLYHMSLRVGTESLMGKVSVNDAAEIIVFAAGLNSFKKTPESEKVLANLLLAASIQAILIEHIPSVEVSCRDNGIVNISCKGTFSQENRLKGNINDLLKNIDGISKIVYKITQ